MVSATVSATAGTSEIGFGRSLRVTLLYYPHMAVGKVWMYRLLFLFVCFYVDRWRGGATGRALDLRSTGRNRFNYGKPLPCLYADRRTCCQLTVRPTTVPRLSHWSPTFVYNTMGVTWCVARVSRRWLRLVINQCRWYVGLQTRQRCCCCRSMRAR